MTPLKIEIEEKRNYTQRAKKSKTIAGVVLGIIIGIDCIINPSIEMVFTGVLYAFVAVIIIYYSDKWDLNLAGDRYFIILIEFKENEIHISYKDKLELKQMKGKRDDFDFQKRQRTFTHGLPPYLQIMYKRKAIISQYSKGDWSENKFDDIIKCAGPNPF